MSPQDILHEVLWEPHRAFVRIPGMLVIDTPQHFQLITPLFKDGPLNEVSCSHLPEAEADAFIDARIAEYRERGLKFRWHLDPSFTPGDLDRRLESRGLARTELRGMHGGTAPVGGPPRPGITVEEVDASNVDEMNATMGRAWSLDTGPIEAYHRFVLAAQPRLQHMFLARVDGQAAGTAAYCQRPRSAYLMGGVVLPEFRGRGVYTAMIDARLAHAAARGLRMSTTQARASTSAPILERLGFETACRFTAFLG